MTAMGSLEMRQHGDSARPTLVYLPGIHGDWTLVTDFRNAVKDRIHFLEFSYPRTLTWSLADYATAILGALNAATIRHGWLLGESFGSQVVWAILEQVSASPSPASFQVQGIILAGGFVRHPWPWAVRSAHFFAARMPDGWLNFLFRIYALYARQRHRHAPETLAHVREFIRRRLERADRLAIRHRLHLIARNDPQSIAAQMLVPVYSLVGLVDPIVPALPVRRWLQKNCPGYRRTNVAPRADHNVLGTAPLFAAKQVAKWMRVHPGQPTPAQAVSG